MKQQANQYEVALNLRGRARQFGVKSYNYVKRNGKQNIIIVGAALVLFAIFSIISGGFAAKENLLAMIKSLVPYAILGLGVTFVIATGGIDLSIGTVMVASGVIAGAVCRTTTEVTSALWLTIPLMMLVGLLFGLLNGVLIAKLKLPPFIATLGTMMFSRGISAVISNAINKSTTAVKYPASSYFQKIFTNINGFPIGIVWLIVLVALCMYLMYKCKIGRYILAIGSNEEATRLSGINVAKYKIIAYAIGGLFAGIAALFWTAANPSLTLAGGNGMELDAIAGVYIGGTSTTGGFASIAGTIFGAMILVIIRQGLNFTLIQFDSNINASFITYTVTGIIVVVAVLMDILKTKAGNKVRNETSKKFKKKYQGDLEALRVKQDYILSDKSLSLEERTLQSDAVVKEILTLKESFRTEYPKLVQEDRTKAAEIKAQRAEAKKAEREQRAELKKHHGEDAE